MHGWESWILGSGLLLGLPTSPVQAQDIPQNSPSTQSLAADASYPPDDSISQTVQPGPAEQKSFVLDNTDHSATSMESALPQEPTPSAQIPQEGVISSLCQLARPQNCLTPTFQVLDAEPLSYHALDLIPIAPISPTPTPIIREPTLAELPDPSESTQNPNPVLPSLPRWSVSLYGGILNSVNVQESLLLTSDLENSYMAGIGATQALMKRRTFNLELDGQLLRHWGDQNHWELTTAVSFRWKDFFWDKYIDTSFAVGEGLSLATAVPEIESERNGKSNQLLNYLMFEWTFALPNKPEWELVMRMNHRSGIFGIFNEVSAGSNLYGAGLRRHF